VNPADAEFVLLRDGECVIAKLERWGWLTPHEPCSGRLTIEHVKAILGMSIRRLHSRRWMVAACWHHNVNGECSRQRDHIRRYLDLIHPGSIVPGE
jgi:hypothetical protein